MSVLPLNLIKGTRSVVYERLENTEDTEEVEHQIDKLKAKVCVCEVNSDQMCPTQFIYHEPLSVAVLGVTDLMIAG